MRVKQTNYQKQKQMLQDLSDRIKLALSIMTEEQRDVYYETLQNRLNESLRGIKTGVV